MDGSEQDLLSILRRITRVIRLENAMNHLVFGAWAGLLLIAPFLTLRESVSDEFRVLIPKTLSSSAESVIAVVLFGTACIVSMLFGWHRRWTVSDTVTILEQQFHFRDGLLSAWEFFCCRRQDSASLLHIREIQDALQRCDISSLRRRGKARRLLVPVVIAVGVVFMDQMGVWPRPAFRSDHAGINQAAKQELIAQIKQDLKNLESQAAESQSDRRRNLQSTSRKLLNDLNRSELTVQQALEAISEAQSEIRKQRADLRAGVSRKLLTDTAKSLMSPDELTMFETAIADGDLSVAAASIDQLAQKRRRPKGNPATIPPHQEQNDPAEMLRELADAMKRAGLHELAAELNELSETEFSDSDNHSSRTLKALANAFHAQRDLEALAASIEATENRLNDSKNLARRQDGELDIQRTRQNSSDVLTAESAAGTGDGSDNGSGSGGSGNAAGSSTTGQTLGAATEGSMNRIPERLSGRLDHSKTTDAGTRVVRSDSESLRQGTAERQKQVVNAEYIRSALATMDSEAVPYHHRETIRRYFETLRHMENDQDSAVRAESESEPLR
ncbi:MAG: hypothetical protein ACK526_09650 [Planctomyces sp.]